MPKLHPLRSITYLVDPDAASQRGILDPGELGRHRVTAGALGECFEHLVEPAPTPKPKPSEIPQDKTIGMSAQAAAGVPKFSLLQARSLIETHTRTHHSFIPHRT